MKLFADTASISEIEFCFNNHVNEGITTNPKIMELTGDLSLGFDGACKTILTMFSWIPVSLETDLGGIEISKIEQEKEKVREILLKQAYSLASLGKNVVIKVPICEGGLLAVKELSEKGIKTNVTACMTPYQALAAAKAGATYVSIFANRVLDCHILSMSGKPLKYILEGDWKKIVKENKEPYFNAAWDMTLKQIAYTSSELKKKYTKTELIIGSIRTAEDLQRIAKAAPNIITIPTKIVKDFSEKYNILELKQSIQAVDYTGAIIGDSLFHPMTTYTLDEFEKAADTYRNKKLS